MAEFRLGYLFLAAGLILANAFFVSVEFALVGLRRTRIEQLAAQGNRAALGVKHLLAHLNETLSACQIGITIASLALGWVGEDAFARLLQGSLTALGWPESGAAFSVHAFAVAGALMLLTFLHVVLGEQAPKIIALQGPETWALWIAWPMRLANGLLWPLVWFLNHSTQLVVKAFGLKPVAAHARAHSEEELGMILDESRKAGVVSRDEHRMLERVFRFHDKTVKEIMAPRPDIVAVNLRANEKELLRLFLESGYSRLPVYNGSLDKIAGLVFVKDLLYALEHPELIKLVDLLREVDLVPETYPLPNLLKDFQKHHKHLAMVVDEYGATAGLVTLEDVVEEIVGEIRDEHDVEPEEIQRLPDGTLLVECRLSLDRFREVFPGLPLPRGDFDTVGGLVLQLAGKLPKEGDSFRVGELAIRVVKREGRRLRRVAVRRIPPGQTQSVPVFGGELPSGVMPFSETLETRAPGDERPSGARPADPGKRK